MERFIDNLEISPEDRELLRQYCQIKDEMEEFKSTKSSRRLDKIKDFIQSADPAVRERAEFELQQVLDDMKYIQQQGLLDKFSEGYNKLIQGNKSDEGKDDLVKSENSDPETDPVQAASNPASVHSNPAQVVSNPASAHSNLSGHISGAGSLHSMPELEDDDLLSIHSNVSGLSGLTWDPRHDFGNPANTPQVNAPQVNPNINITLPNLNINITQPPVNAPNPFTRRPLVARSPARQASQGNVENWLVGQSPQHGPDPPAGQDPTTGNPAGVTTRSGRLSKPVSKFDPTVESQLQKDLRSALQKSQPSAGAKGSKTVKTGASKAPATKPATVASKPSGIGEKSKNTGVTMKSIVTAKSAATKLTAGVSKGATASNAPADDISKKSTMTARTPVKDDISKRSTKTVRTPPSAPTGANRLSDNEDDPIFD
jgi:hypothetical protein